VHARRIAAVVLFVAGVLVATIPTHETLTFPSGDNEPRLSVSIRCVAPIAGAFGDDSDDAWFGYAPNTGVAYSPDAHDCPSSARRRVGIGAALVVLGAAALFVRRGAPAVVVAE
jgi:hypothetical protein